VTVIADRRPDEPAGDPTGTADRAPTAPEPSAVRQVTPGDEQGADEHRRPLLPLTPRRIGAVVAAWLLVTIVGVGLVLYGLGPMLEQRDQRHLLTHYRVAITHAANEAFGLPGVEKITEAPDTGAPVAIMEIPAIHFRQVMVEGVGPQQTRHGPGHVPGTAGPGQPGNAAVAGRNAAFGGPFSQIDKLKRGDEIVVTTVQGQTLYVVSDERHGKIRPAPKENSSSPTASTTTTTTAPANSSDSSSSASSSGRDEPTVRLPKRLTFDAVYGPSPDDRLTLVTAGTAMPLSTNPATIVVAEMKTRPFEPTPQGGRNASQDGRGRDSSALATFVLAFMGYAAAAAAAVLLYRRTRPRSAYLMSAPLLVVSTVLIAEAAARLLPAWF
jgi:sortase A